MAGTKTGGCLSTAIQMLVEGSSGSNRAPDNNRDSNTKTSTNRRSITVQAATAALGAVQAQQAAAEMCGREAPEAAAKAGRSAVEGWGVGVPMVCDDTMLGG